MGFLPYDDNGLGAREVKCQLLLPATGRRGYPSPHTLLGNTRPIFQSAGDGSHYCGRLAATRNAGDFLTLSGMDGAFLQRILFAIVFVEFRFDLAHSHCDRRIQAQASHS